MADLPVLRQQSSTSIFAALRNHFGPLQPAVQREALATGKGVLAYGAVPEIESLFQAQLGEMDRKKALLHQIQRLVQERALLAPIWENGFIRAYGPRMEEAALSLIPAFP